MNFREKILNRFQLLNVAEKLIALNVLFFVLPLLINTFLYLFKIPIDSYIIWFELFILDFTFENRDWSCVQ